MSIFILFNFRTEFVGIICYNLLLDIHGGSDFGDLELTTFRTDSIV